MRDGLPAKLGNWYEEGYVVLQLLLLLSEEVQSVAWEPPSETGVDLLVTADDREIAIQCKHRSPDRSWTLRTLSGVHGASSLLEHAKRFLDKDCARVYRIVADRPASDLEMLIRSVRLEPSAAIWWAQNSEKASQLVSAWGLDGNSPTTPAILHSLLGRIEVEILNQAHVDRQCRSLARLHAGSTSDADQLLRVLFDTAKRYAKNRRILRAADLRVAVESADVALQPRASDPLVHDVLGGLAKGYRSAVSEVRTLKYINRTDVDAAWRAISESSPAQTVLVHGPAGCGKTEIIAKLTERLEQAAWVTLVTTPDRLHDLGLGEDPIAALVRYAAGEPTVLVMDQLDTALWAGARAHVLLRPVRDLLRRAREHGVRVVAGCRTVDAEHETQLRQMLSGTSGEPPLAIAVRDLDEADYGPVLAEAGVALADLLPSVRKLASRPLYLRLIRKLLDHGVDLSRVDSLPDLMDKWWAQVNRDLDSAEIAVLDELIDRMEFEGRLQVRADGLCAPDALGALKNAGLIAVEDRDGRRFARPTHQILVDMRIAYRWRKLRTPRELLEKLGSKDEQSFHTAGRLRLAIPLLRDHPRAAECLGEVIGSDEVRPLVKHAVFKAFAEIEDPRRSEVSLVEDWLRSDLVRPRVLARTVRGSAAWVAALDDLGWLEEAWISGGEKQQSLILDLLGSVSTSWGDGVARLLSRWAKSGSEVLDRAGWVFLHEPGKDTDALFELRLESYTRGSQRIRPTNWQALLSDNADRALRLLGVLLPREEFEVLREHQVPWAVMFPRPGNDAIREASKLGTAAWIHLGPWWRALEGVVLQRVQTAEGLLPEGLIVRVVGLLARCFANALEFEELTWSSLLEALPRPLRDLDGWLLLRIGAVLEAVRQEVSDDALRWFRSEDRWSRLQVGYRGLPWDLAGEFLRTVSELATDDAIRDLEEWILNYRNPWTAEDERRRWEHRRDYGTLLPSQRGALAYHLLPCLPEGRIGVRGTGLLRELRRKFGPSDFSRSGVSGGYVCSPVPDRTADRWRPAEWMAHLAHAREHGKWPGKQEDPHSIAVYERDTLLQQLFRLAQRQPRKYLAHALAFDDQTFAKSVAERARHRVLLAISCKTRPDSASDDPNWSPLTDVEVASVVCLRSYLGEETLASTVARIVRERSEFHWPREVRRRLETIAEAAPEKHDAGLDEYGLQIDRLNDDGNLAIQALAALASHHPEHRHRVLEVVERFTVHPDSARKASAAVAAWACRDADATRAESLVLEASADPLVAAEHDICSYLLHLACGEDTCRTRREQARRRLLALVENEQPHVARWGGQVLVVLRRHSAIGDERIENALTARTEVRQGMAELVARYLAQGHQDDWLESLAIRLADDETREVGSKLARVFAHRDSDHLLDRKEFINALIATRALRRAPGDLLRAFDKRAELTPVSRWVLRIASELASTSTPEDYLAGRLNARSVCGLVSRLVEEAERCGDMGLRSEALDAWDELIDRDVHHAYQELEARWAVA